MRHNKTKQQTKTIALAFGGLILFSHRSEIPIQEHHTHDRPSDQTLKKEKKQQRDEAKAAQLKWFRNNPTCQPIEKPSGSSYTYARAKR